MRIIAIESGLEAVESGGRRRRAGLVGRLNGATTYSFNHLPRIVNSGVGDPWDDLELESAGLRGWLT
jgi:hypothetical protein